MNSKFLLLDPTAREMYRKGEMGRNQVKGEAEDTGALPLRCVHKDNSDLKGEKG